MKQNDNKLHNVPKMLGITILLLSGLSLLGGFSIGEWSPKPVRLYSDLTKGWNDADDDFPDDSLLWAQIQAPIPVAAQPDPNPAEPQTPAADTARTAVMNTVPVEDF